MSKPKKEKFYKWLDKDREPLWSGRGRYPAVGKWTEPRDVDPCFSGYHVCRLADIHTWAGGVLWEVEGRGVRVDSNSKVVFEQVRLLRRLGTPTEADYDAACTAYGRGDDEAWAKVILRRLRARANRRKRAKK